MNFWSLMPQEAAEAHSIFKFKKGLEKFVDKSLNNTEITERDIPSKIHKTALLGAQGHKKCLGLHAFPK